MKLKINDWEFDIDDQRTAEHSSLVVSEHCSCGYCENYYRAVKKSCPDLAPFLARFRVHVDGPSEMYPIEPTLYLAGYRVFGRVLRAGSGPMMVSGIPVTADIREPDQFMLEVGEMILPWVLEEDMDEVISPANEPEFLDKMYRKLLSRGSGFICS